MSIQWSLVLFTVIASAGAWLLGCAGIQDFREGGHKSKVIASIVALVLMVVGGIASATHLSHVDRIFGVLQHPAPGIFLEALLLGITFVIGLVLLVMWRKNEQPTGATKVLSVLAIVMAVVFSYSCGASYMMSSQLSWNTPLLPLGYFGTAMATGTALWALVTGIQKEPEAVVKLAGTLTLAGGAVALVLAVAYGVATGIATGSQAALFWLGVVVCGGAVPAACGIMIRKKPQSAVAYAAVALIGGCIGAIAFRSLMWLASDALMTLFGTTI